MLLLGWAFVNTSPARLARGLKWTGIGLAAVAVLALPFPGGWRCCSGLPPGWCRVLCRMRSTIGGLRGPAVGNSSTVETPFVRMTLDHDTGRMTGTVLQGRFAGMRVDELGRVELLALLRECRTVDEEGARLVEAYLDRTDPDWRADLHGAQAGGSRPRSHDLRCHRRRGLCDPRAAPGADEEAIKAAHHRLMKQLHPDHGGTDYLAAKLNRARDVLLRR